MSDERPPLRPAADGTEPASLASAADDALLMPLTDHGDPAGPAATPPGFDVPNRYTGRFLISYGLLGVVLAGAIAIAISAGLSSRHGPAPNKSWSNWSPQSGSTAQVTSSIAAHVSEQYHLNASGAPLVGADAEPLTYTSGTHKLAISAVAIRKKANSNNGIVFYTTSGAYADLLCGLGTSCAIASGTASVTRGRLVRREALEIALYTFKFAPAVSSLIAYMPPPPGSTAETLLYFQKANLTKQLSQPLDKTLPLAKPPLPSQADPLEQKTIDALTLPALYSYSLAALQDGSLALVLTPVAA